jgi:hypothetical protein
MPVGNELQAAAHTGLRRQTRYGVSGLREPLVPEERGTAHPVIRTPAVPYFVREMEKVQVDTLLLQLLKST